HHHPFEVWGQDDYHGLAAFFSRVRRKDNKDNGQYGGAQSVSVAPARALTDPATRRGGPPRVLRRPPLGGPAGQEPRRRPGARARRPGPGTGPPRTSPATSSTATGAPSSAAAWSSRWTTCAPPTRPRTRPCSTPWRRTSPTTATTSSTCCGRCAPPAPTS